MGQSRPLFHLFSSFQTHITNFTTNRYVKKYPSSIQCQDSNLRPLEHQPSPITTHPLDQGSVVILSKQFFRFGSNDALKERKRLGNREDNF